MRPSEAQLGNNSEVMPPALRSEASPPRGPIPLVFVIADTGGGHRTAARAVSEAVERNFPGTFEVTLYDPLGGPESSRLLRWVTGLYGPSIRIAPWTWGAIYYASDSRPVMGFLQHTILRLARRPLTDTLVRHRPALIASFHPLVGKSVLVARRRVAPNAPVATVVTDLITPHIAWRYAKVDKLLVPSAAVRWRCHLDGLSPEECVEVGLPVGHEFARGPLHASQRAALRQELGLSGDRFVVVLTGGGEGSGGIAKRATALAEHFPDVDVVAICGRNRRLQRKLSRVAARYDDHRLHVRGFVHNMADWLACADVVVTKAGPGTISEATCCGAPLLLTSHVPGQEKGNTEYVVGAGAGRDVSTVDALVAEVERLRRDPAAVDAMRAASTRLSRPYAADAIADVLASMVGVRLVHEQPGPASAGFGTAGL